VRRSVVGVSVALGVLFMVAAAQAQPNTLVGTTGGPHPPLVRSPQGIEMLFRGDLGAEAGIGCSNSAGTSGGPNDWAVGVTASFAPPFFITSTTYNLFTQVSPNITSLSFVAWTDSAGSPGVEFGRQMGLPLTQGNHTVLILPSIPVTAASSFFFGLNQAQSNVGMRVGLDQTTTGGGFSMIRAPGCGASSFFDVTALGFPGNWVMAAVVDDSIPVELTSFEVD